jgi:uncharacterized protein YbaR (Trm112 family)
MPQAVPILQCPRCQGRLVKVPTEPRHESPTWVMLECPDCGQTSTVDRSTVAAAEAAGRYL